MSDDTTAVADEEDAFQLEEPDAQTSFPDDQAAENELDATYVPEPELDEGPEVTK